MDKERLIIICGFSRSGSTLFYNLIRNTIKGLEVFDRELSALEVINKPGSHITKRPLDCFCLQQIIASNQREKRIDVIFCIRDPRALITSMHQAVPGDYFISFENQYFIDPQRDIATRTNPGINDVMKAFRSIYGIYALKYEELVEHPDLIQQSLAETYQLEFSGKFSEFDETAAVPEQLQGPLNEIRAIDKKGLAAWKKHPVRIWEQFTTYPELFGILKELGYEEDTQWFKDMFRHRLKPLA